MNHLELIYQKLDQINKKIDDHNEKSNERHTTTQVKLGKLEIKSTLWGAAGGFLALLPFIGYVLYLK